MTKLVMVMMVMVVVQYLHDPLLEDDLVVRVAQQEAAGVVFGRGGAVLQRLQVGQLHSHPQFTLLSTHLKKDKEGKLNKYLRKIHEIMKERKVQFVSYQDQCTLSLSLLLSPG